MSGIRYCVSMYETSQTDKVLTVKRYNRKMGRKSQLNQELFNKIRELTLEGKKLKAIAKEIDISYKTLYDWNVNNYQQFNERINDFRRERKLLQAEEELDSLLKDKSSNIRLDATKFTLETLGKKYYSKKESNINIINVPTPILSGLADSTATQIVHDVKQVEKIDEESGTGGEGSGVN